VVRINAADPTQRTTLAEGLGVPAGLAATDDDLWVSDWEAGAVLQIFADGKLLNPAIVVATGLVHPEGLAVGPDGNLLVAETGAGRLSHIDLATGEVFALVEGLALGLPGSPAFPPSHICTGVAVGSSGTIYITSDVLNQLLAIRVVDPTLVAHWKLDETGGMIASDDARDHDGTVVGSPAWLLAGGVVGGALEFNGTTYVSADFILNPQDGPLSVFAWVKGGASGQVVISQQSGVNWLMADAASGVLVTELKQSGRQGKPLTSAAGITDGGWHRVGLVWDGSSRILYVDDIEVAKDTQTGLANAFGGLYLGAGSTLVPGSFFSGLIDDVRIYSRAVKP